MRRYKSLKRSKIAQSSTPTQERTTRTNLMLPSQRRRQRANKLRIKLKTSREKGLPRESRRRTETTKIRSESVGWLVC